MPGGEERYAFLTGLNEHHDDNKKHIDVNDLEYNGSTGYLKELEIVSEYLVEKGHHPSKDIRALYPLVVEEEKNNLEGSSADENKEDHIEEDDEDREQSELKRSPFFPRKPIRGFPCLSSTSSSDESSGEEQEDNQVNKMNDPDYDDGQNDDGCEEDDPGSREREDVLPAGQVAPADDGQEPGNIEGRMYYRS